MLCTLKSTVAFFSLFFTLDLAFLFLAIGYLRPNAAMEPNPSLIKAGGWFGMMAAFLAWYNALAGIADTSNRYDHPPDVPRLPNGRLLTDLSFSASSSFQSPTFHGQRRVARTVVSPRTPNILHRWSLNFGRNAEREGSRSRIVCIGLQLPNRVAGFLGRLTWNLASRTTARGRTVASGAFMLGPMVAVCFFASMRSKYPVINA